MEARTVLVQAAVAPAEQPALRSALEHLAASLDAHALAPIAFRCEFRESPAAITTTDAPSIVILSCLPDADPTLTPWPDAARRLRADCERLAGHDSLAVFLCTILRHVAPVPDDDGRQAGSTRVRIRRLNLLAAELSCDTGIHVIDIDRALADIGARALQTDHRLGGPFAAEAAARAIALTVLAASPECLGSYDLQDAAKADIEAWQPAETAPNALPPPIATRDVMAMGAGRSQQRVSVVAGPTIEHWAGTVLGLLLRRQIGVRYVLVRIARRIAREGLRPTLALVVGGLRHFLRARTRVAR